VYRKSAHSRTGTNGLLVLGLLCRTGEGSPIKSYTHAVCPMLPHCLSCCGFCGGIGVWVLCVCLATSWIPEPGPYPGAARHWAARSDKCGDLRSIMAIYSATLIEPNDLLDHTVTYYIIFNYNIDVYIILPNVVMFPTWSVLVLQSSDGEG
jgi:hypothetical protein